MCSGLCEPGSSPLWLTLLQNCESRTTELLLTFPARETRDSWADLLTPPSPSQVMVRSPGTPWVDLDNPSRSDA